MLLAARQGGHREEPRQGLAAAVDGEIEQRRDGRNRQPQLAPDAAQPLEEVGRGRHRLEEQASPLVGIAAVERIGHHHPQERIALGAQRRPQEGQVLLVGRDGQRGIGGDARLELGRLQLLRRERCQRGLPRARLGSAGGCEHGAEPIDRGIDRPGAAAPVVDQRREDETLPAEALHVTGERGHALERSRLGAQPAGGIGAFHAQPHGAVSGGDAERGHELGGDGEALPHRAEQRRDLPRREAVGVVEAAAVLERIASARKAHLGEQVFRHLQPLGPGARRPLQLRPQRLDQHLGDEVGGGLVHVAHDLGQLGRVVRLQEQRILGRHSALDPPRDADTAPLEEHPQRLSVIESRVADPAVQHHRIGPERDPALHLDAGLLAVGQGVRAQLAATVLAHGDDLVPDGEIVASVGLDVDAGARPGPIAGRHVDADGVVVERESTDARRPGFVTRLLLPAGAEFLAVEERVVEDDVANFAQAAMPEIGDEPIEALGADGGIAAPSDVEDAGAAALQRAVGEVVGGEAVLRPQPQERRSRGDQLGVGGRIELLVGAARIDGLAVLQRIDLDGDVRAEKRRLREQLVDGLAQRLAVGRRGPGRRCQSEAGRAGGEKRQRGAASMHFHLGGWTPLGESYQAPARPAMKVSGIQLLASPQTKGCPRTTSGLPHCIPACESSPGFRPGRRRK